MAGAPEWLIEHRELEYLRAVGKSIDKRTKKPNKREKSRIKERYQKLREVKH